MEINRLVVPIFLVILCLIFVGNGDSASHLSNPFLGIAPQDEKYFDSETIKCNKGSKKFSKAQLNDDFCDCPDGTDEPGTSACPYGKFYCRNAGHAPIFLPSSRVNDGICDCCDGSDEYDNKVKCPNTCWEAGNVARDKLKKKIATYMEGVIIRNKEIEKAKQAIVEDEAELSKLKTEEKTLQRLVKQLRVRKEQIEKLEEEGLLKEKEEKAKEASKKDAQNEEDEAMDGSGKEEVGKASDDEKIGLLEDPPLEQHEKDESENTEELSREELGRLVASRWTGEKTEQQVEESDGAKDELADANEIPESVHGGEQNHGEDDMEDVIDDEHVEDNEVDSTSAVYKSDPEDQNDADITTVSSRSWLDKIQETVKNILQSVFPTSIDKSDADRVRKEYEDSSTKLSDMQSRISSLTEKLKHDFGPEKEFYSWFDRCFETKQNKYVYKVCPFKDASQEEGYSRTGLGQWEKFENSYRIMVFSNGDKCWNGPDRSLKVKLRCGLKTELTDVDEPSRCEYVSLMSTPALCVQEKLQELEHKLESMDKMKPQDHDEL